jgi:hypothetical protein
MKKMKTKIEAKEVCRDCKRELGNDYVNLCPFHSATFELLQVAVNAAKELKIIVNGTREDIEGNLGLTATALKELKAVISRMEKMV